MFLVATLLSATCDVPAFAKSRSNYDPYPDYSDVLKDPPLKLVAIPVAAAVGVVLIVLLVRRSHAPSRGVPKSVAPKSVDFGGVAMGGTRTQAVTFRNEGATVLEVRPAALPGRCFSFEKPWASPLMLTGGGQASISVVFTPESKGACSGILKPTVSEVVTGKTRIFAIRLAGRTP